MCREGAFTELTAKVTSTTDSQHKLHGFIYFILFFTSIFFISNLFLLCYTKVDRGNDLVKFQYETNRLVLRIEHEDAAKKVLEFYENNQGFFEPYEFTRPKNFYTESFMRATLSAEFQTLLQKKGIRFYAYKKEDLDHIIGTMSFSNIRLGGFQTTTLGYKLDYGHQHQGFATEFCQKGLSIIFDELHLHRIIAQIVPDNKPSIELIKRLGFTYEGTERKSIKVQGHFKDHDRYALLKEEYSI